jgi:hypothetical protein
MGFLLFTFGLVLIVLSFLAVLNFTAMIEGLMIGGFLLLGFILCVTGFIMANSVVGGMMERFRR